MGFVRPNTYKTNGYVRHKNCSEIRRYESDFKDQTNTWLEDKLGAILHRTEKIDGDFFQIKC